MGRRALVKARRRVVNAYLREKTVREIAQQEGVSTETIYNVLREERVVRSTGETLRGHSRPIVRKYRVDENAFVISGDRHITSEQAYWIGFLMADGNVDSHALTLTLAPRDAGHLRKLRKFLDSTHPIKMIAGYPRLHVGSVVLVKSLARWGVIPRKSLIAKVNGLENNRHFWRGVVDGDGSVARWKQGVSLHLVGARPLLEQFAQFIKRRTGRRTIVEHHANVFRVRIHGKPARRLIRRLYAYSHVALNRKLAAARQILAV